MADEAVFKLEEHPPYPELARWEEEQLKILKSRARGGGLQPIERMQLQALVERKRRMGERTKPD